MKPILHFAHANGVPSKTYQKLFEALSDDYDVIYVPLLGTNSHYPVDNHWKMLTQQIIDSIETQAKGRKVIGFGHSLGALTTFMASRLRPDLFSQVIMLDPPMIVGKEGFFMHIAKLIAPEFVDKHTPAALSAKRRDHWASREEAKEKLAGRGIFKDFDQDCFEAYIQYGLQEDVERGGVTLTIPKQVEVEIFRTSPTLWWLPQPKIKVPVHLVVGRDSQFEQRGFPKKISKKFGIPYSVMQGGHMFPLEYPFETVAKIKSLLK